MKKEEKTLSQSPLLDYKPAPKNERGTVGSHSEPPRRLDWLLILIVVLLLLTVLIAFLTGVPGFLL